MKSNEKKLWPLMNDNILSEDKFAMVNHICSKNPRFTQGKKVKEFENAWSDWLGVEHSTYVNSGASANYVMASIMRSKTGPGEVIVPALCWISDVAPLLSLGLTPVFVDVDIKTFSLDVKKVSQAINKNTVGIILVHGLGFNGLSNELLELVKNNDLFLIEDCCESHGAEHDGVKVGNFGNMSNFSYYFGHHMTTIEGGMVCSNNKELDDYAKAFRSHGFIRDTSDEFKQKHISESPDINPLFLFSVPGFNVRSTELNAILGLSQLPRLDSNIEIRKRNFIMWRSTIHPDRYFNEYLIKGNSNFALPLVLKNKDNDLRNRIISYLDHKGIEFRTGTIGGGNQARQPYLKNSGKNWRVHDSLDQADHIQDFGLYIGNHNDINAVDILNLANQLNSL